MGSMITDEQFESSYRTSKPAVMAVAGWMVGLGYDVQIPGMRLRPKRDQARDYVDSGDLLLLMKHRAPMRIEVKGLTCDWTSQEEYRRRYPELLICTTHSFDHLVGDMPYSYHLVNRQLTHQVVINVQRTREQWYRDVRHNSVYNIDQEYYFCPLDCGMWLELS